MSPVLFHRNTPLFLVSIATIAFLYAPIVLLVVMSFNDSPYIAFPIQHTSTRWYGLMLGNDQLWQALGNSLRVGVIASLTATLIAVLAAKAVTRYRFKGQRPTISLIMSPLVIPEVILGTALLVLLLSAGLELSLLTVTIGHVVICTPYALAVMISRYAGFDPSLEEASFDLGETALGTFWRVTLPLLLPGVVSALLLSFLISFDDFVVAFFLTGSERTLPVFVYNQLRFPKKLPEVLALAVCLLLISIVLVAFAEWLRRRDGAVEEI
ncbi:MAG: ABC transporter permease [Geminicoccaceae bacterium]